MSNGSTTADTAVSLRARARMLSGAQTRLWAAASMVALGAGSPLAWLSASALGAGTITVTLSGFVGRDGWWTLGTAVVGLIVLLDPVWAPYSGWPARHRHDLWRALMWFSAANCFDTIFWTLAGQDEPWRPVWGLYLVLAALLSGLAAEWTLRQQRTSRTGELTPPRR
jgi:hypothetical protein